MSEFLETEYEKCLDLVKFYDERQYNLVKFSAAVTSVVPTLLVGIYKAGGGVDSYFWHFVLLASVAATVALISVFLGIVQTRLYFIYPARQVNAIRAHLIKPNEKSGFVNQMYSSINFSAFKWLSTQTLMMLFVALEIGFFVSISIYAAYSIVPKTLMLGVVASIVGSVSSISLLVAAGVYLKTSSKKAADQSIHRES